MPINTKYTVDKMQQSCAKNANVVAKEEIQVLYISYIYWGGMRAKCNHINPLSLNQSPEPRAGGTMVAKQSNKNCSHSH